MNITVANQEKKDEVDYSAFSLGDLFDINVVVYSEQHSTKELQEAFSYGKKFFEDTESIDLCGIISLLPGVRCIGDKQFMDSVSNEPIIFYVDGVLTDASFLDTPVEAIERIDITNANNVPPSPRVGIHSGTGKVVKITTTRSPKGTVSASGNSNDDMQFGASYAYGGANDRFKSLSAVAARQTSEGERVSMLQRLTYGGFSSILQGHKGPDGETSFSGNINRLLEFGKNLFVNPYAIYTEGIPEDISEMNDSRDARTAIGVHANLYTPGEWHNFSAGAEYAGDGDYKVTGGFDPYFNRFFQAYVSAVLSEGGKNGKESLVSSGLIGNTSPRDHFLLSYTQASTGSAPSSETMSATYVHDEHKGGLSFEAGVFQFMRETIGFETWGAKAGITFSSPRFRLSANGIYTEVKAGEGEPSENDRLITKSPHLLVNAAGAFTHGKHSIGVLGRHEQPQEGDSVESLQLVYSLKINGGLTLSVSGRRNEGTSTSLDHRDFSYNHDGTEGDSFRFTGRYKFKK